MYYRNCPKCQCNISYKYNSDKLKADRVNSFCKKCMINSGKFLKGDNTRINKKPIYECWLEKYGKEKADLKWNDLVKKQSINNSGEKNSMYGKSTPVGSGNGWSGWYKGWYFRSLLELSYMIKIIERFKLNWKTAESKQLTVKYEFLGKARTYRADFLIKNKYLVDCKPKKLHSSTENIAKKQAMVEFCEENNLIFKYSEIPKLTIQEINHLYKTSQIKFLERYERKFKQQYEAL